MDNRFKVTIKRRTQSYWLILMVVFMPFALGTLNDFLGLPHALRYLIDVAWLALTLLLVLNRQRRKAPGIQTLMVWSAAFFFFTLLTYPASYQSVTYYLWGVRNNFRFYVAFFAMAMFLTQEDAAGFYKVFDQLFWLNFVVSLFQYYVLGLEQDYLGGLFGADTGCNAYTNAFFLIIISKSMIFYLDKRESLVSCISKCVASLIIAAFAELKFYFVEFLLVVALAVLISNFTWRKLWIILGGCIAAIGGAALLTIAFPSFTQWFSLEWFWDVATAKSGYTASGDLNRLTAIISINDLWLKNWGQRLFGLGMGNCETSGFAFLNTPFYRQYGHMHYNWMSYAHMYLECGWIGLLLFLGFFGLVFLYAYRIGKRSGGLQRNYCRIAQIAAILSVVIAVYNSTLRFEAAYMLYFAMAVPFAAARHGAQKASLQ